MGLALPLLALLGAPLLLPHAALAMGAAYAGPLTPDVVAKFFLAGGICCCVSHAVVVPIDVVKTRQQSDPKKYIDKTSGQPMGMVGTAAFIVQQEGPGMLLQGLGSTAAGYLVQGAFKYGMWEVFKSALGYSAAVGSAKIAVLVGAAFAAECIASTLLTPFERARIKLVADPSYAEGLLPALSRLLKEDGPLKGLFGDGLLPTLIKMTAYTTAQLTTFTLVSEALAPALPADLPRLALTLPSAVLAGFTASIASQPGDTLQTCTSTNTLLGEECPVDILEGPDGKPTVLGLAGALGLSGLFTGWQARLVQMEIIVVTQLLVYDTVKSAVGL